MATSADGRVTDRRAGLTGPALRGAVPLVVALLTGAASPHHVDGGAAVSFLTAPLAATLGVTGLLAGALVAGIALLRGPATPTRRTAIAAEAGAGYAVAVLALGWLGGGTGALTAVPRTAAVVAVAVLLTRTSRPVTVVAGALLTALVVVETGLAIGPAPAVSVLAAVLGLGVPATVAGAADRRAELRARTPLAVLAIATAVVSALVGAVQSGSRLDAATLRSANGIILAVGLVLTVAAALGWVLARAAAGRWVLPAAVGAGGAAIVVLTTLVALPAVALPDRGAPLLRTVALGDLAVPVAVVPQRPGPNLVYVGAAGATVDGVATRTRSGSPGSWAVVDIPAGAEELVVTAGTGRAVLRLQPGVDPAPAALVAGLTGPDGPECLSAVLGAVVGGGVLPGACPDAALTDSDAATLRATVRFLAQRAAPALHVIDDGSPRSTAAAGVVTAAAAEHGLPLTDAIDTTGAILVVAGWETAGARLTDEALGLSSVHGTYTAPWLATGPVLGRQTGAVTALVFDPRAEQGQRYVADLRARGITALASPAGLAAWGGGPESGPRIFTAVQVSVMPGDHRHPTDTWLPGGTFTAVTPPLPV
ncbi:hypothetical protein [Pseudonocardia abyssalis]|uniref:Uncharacterized protein n=1 Tax=Pseudonocardia abyssalis TaxID=2792008 RepID=A0ABS6UT29_9PSEU|nr:hypothetical protein [Pseudonocardia abyssalis]MBW0117263.1 hypothetical protein [Pseudonocardia abyssalis]MBW0135415.1 hypothetical protein [Pseudonocardia abyssalis]